MWSDDENYVLLGNTLCDVVGPDVISDIFLHEFTHNYDKLLTQMNLLT